MPVSIDDKAVTQAIESFFRFLSKNIGAPIEKSAEVIRAQLVENFNMGQDIHGNKYQYVSSRTLELPIKRTGAYKDTRIRGDINPSQIAMNATGLTAKLIEVKKVSEKEWTVGWNYARSDIILEGNARAKGNTGKPKRDPVGISERNPSNKEFNAVVDEIEKAIERALGGF
jgi:hypothetical protein